MLTEVGVLQHNASEYTLKCVESLRAQKECDTIITVVDQGSSPEHREAVRHIGDHFIENEENLPIQDVWNDLILGSKCDLVTLVNNDTYLADMCVSRLLSTLDHFPSVGWVSGVYQHGCSWPHCTVMWPDNVIACWESNPEILNAWARGLNPYTRFWNRTEMTVFTIRKSVFIDVGLFDYGAFGCHFHELDYSFRMREIGYVCAVNYGAAFWHWGSRSLRSAMNDGTFHSISREEAAGQLIKNYPRLASSSLYSIEELSSSVGEGW